MRGTVKEICFLVVFFGLISLPAVLALSGGTLDVEVVENRTKAPPPKFELHHLKRTTEAFESYYNDHFALRGLLLTLNKAFRYYLLNTPTAKGVVAGADGWLFYNERGNLEDIRNTGRYSPSELARWVRAYRMRDEFARRYGAKYLLVLAPDKESIYPEKLPGWIPPPGAESRTDQLLAALKSETQVEVLDLRPVMLAHKDEPIYFRTDTHWNDLGAYYAYDALMARLQTLLPQYAAQFQPLPLSHFKKVDAEYSGDIALILGLKDILEEVAPTLVPSRVWNSHISEKPRPNEHHFVSRNPNLPDAPKLYFIRDSFARYMQGMIAEHFSFVRFRWFYGFERKYVLRDKPDLIIEMAVERALPTLKPRAFH